MLSHNFGHFSWVSCFLDGFEVGFKFARLISELVDAALVFLYFLMELFLFIVVFPTQLLKIVFQSINFDLLFVQLSLVLLYFLLKVIQKCLHLIIFLPILLVLLLEILYLLFFWFFVNFNVVLLIFGFFEFFIDIISGLFKIQSFSNKLVF